MFVRQFCFDSLAKTNCHGRGLKFMARTSPVDRFEFERALWSKGITRLAGVDEAGRGPLAGPVVAAAVIFPPVWERALPRELEGLNDSKQLTATQRETYFA